MQIAIAGYGQEGRAVHRYLRRQEEETGVKCDITVCDQNPELEVPEDVWAQLGEGYLEGLDSCDLVYRSPGIRPDTLQYLNPGLDGNRITTATNQFFTACPSGNIIGVTGTKGKGTTTTLIARILTTAGQQAHVGGNIGTPALDLLGDIGPEDWVVLELSSFQLFDIDRSPHIGVCLMIAPDHLDWHTDMEEYVDAKSHIFALQETCDIAVYNADNAYASRLAEKSPGRKIAFGASGEADVRGTDEGIYTDDQKVIAAADIGLRGPHNRENVCAATGAAIAALRESLPVGDCAGVHPPPGTQGSVAAAIRDFHGLEHRLEYVGNANGVSFYNDSFSTNPAPTIAAIRSFSEGQVLILGGSPKGADFEELAREIAGSPVKHAVLTGEEAERLQAALEQAGFTAHSWGGDRMPGLVAEAVSRAETGDVVLLSPACASFDMFADYKDRGQQFKQAVAALNNQ
ncbi:UDP-N-acetylmuramoyl-L-alanine--D-glutamate ligase [Candidatus Saccharibacteria bacterium QS_5_54_17]|nr:MAG: UDP-N-acetylmuramoyl-L-alanine--D-glutamate ligase [Candidatus Saccharibacteria bacterium QS_5_54_17]